MGGILKKVWREALFATPRPVLGHPPLPRRGGGGGPPENSGAKYLCYYHQQPGVVGAAYPISLNCCLAKYEVTFHRFFFPFAEFTAPESALLVPDASSLAATLRASWTSSALSC